MRITKIKLRNSGKHKALDETLDSSVIGLLGPNASGKSTILRLIHFVMTGWTPLRETQESFIRQVDPEFEEQPKFFSVEIEFSAQGNKYRLKRQVGTPASRKLVQLDADGKEIKDETYTSAAEIQSMLTDIFGADKYAIDNAAFPEQGTLDKVLFGGQADREELLVKLLLLGHMQKVADVAAGKIKLLSAEIQDFSVLHDELQNSRTTVETELASLESLFRNCTCYDDEIDGLQKFINLRDVQQTLGDKVRNNVNAHRELTSALKALLDSNATRFNTSLSSLMDVEHWMTRLNANIKDSRQILKTFEGSKNRIETFNTAQARYSTVEAQLKTAANQCPAKPDEEHMAYLRQVITYQEEREKSRVGLVSLQEQHKELSQRNVELISTHKEKYQQAEAIESELALLGENISVLNFVVTACEAALKGKHNGNCPVCDSNIQHLDLEERFDSFSTKLERALDKQRALVKTKNDVTKLLKDMDRESVLTVSALNRATAAIEEIQTRLDRDPDYAIKAAREELADLELQATQFTSAYLNLQKLGAALTEAQVNLNEFTEAEKAAFSVAKIEDYIATIKSYEDKISLREQQLSEFNTLHTEVVSYEAKLQAASDNLAVYHEELAALAAEQEALYASFPERLKALIKTTPNFEEAKAVLSQKNKDYLELKVKTIEMRKQADVLKHRLQDIEKKIQLDHDKRDVIKDLQLIVTAFSRGGIPMAYVQHKFDNLVAMTQENLEIMEANFAIMPHKTKPVSLQFYRTDEPGQVVFDHDKLSGGQKVRLSIAFLLAVQQLVIPDLGLLVLDEPSTHLDKEGKENLKELLLNMGQQMDNSDNQLIVCDHAEELEPAFKHFISFYDN